MPTPPRIRKNIDSLTPDELADYEHAFSKLQEISDTDPDSIDGLKYFQDLHNTQVGPCEHANDTFLPWHRAHLFLFEEALRRSDPPRTANVTLPYWDWSALPSGTRYPNAFENTNSVLHHTFRDDNPVCRTAGATQCDALPFPRKFLEETALNKSDWSNPNRGLSLTSFGGHAGGQMDCQGQFGRGFGALEQPAHNTMHDGFVRGTMGNPAEAAEDPIFFSFHCYIDLLWAQWQEDFESDTGLDSRLCGLFKDREHLEENRFHVRDTLDPETQLGYVYEYAPGEVAPEQREAAAPFPTHPALDVVTSARNRPALVRTIELTVPQPGVKYASLRLTDVHVTTPFSYGADIYLTPAGEELRTEDRAFRERYLANVLYFWQSHHSHGDNTHNITVDLGRAVNSLARSHAGEQWVVTVALTASDSGGNGHGDGHDHGHPEAAAAEAADPAETMNFGDLTLDVS